MGRILIFAYGVACYVLFLGVFAYLPGFLTDSVVPKSINSGESYPLGEALMVNVPLLGLFAVQHTVMARAGFKAWIGRFLPAAMARSTFVLASSLVLALFYWQWRPTADVAFSVEQPALRTLLYGVFLAGIGLVLYTTFLINHFELFGLQQVYHQLTGKQAQPGRFLTPALYKLVRHPMMVGMLLTFWATPHMTVGHLELAIAITGYVLMGIRFEERDLMREFPEHYPDYRRRVPALIAIPRRPEPAAPTDRTAAGATSADLDERRHTG